ncbi:MULTISPECIES: CsbD family protein [unclassified Streptomyces]|uniref:CsbD family protein n=1 Tax=unclassified Streptomyces TaxID=2593676 RepID=UPI002DDAEF0C|nr:CsbD family protein [Streptomyces sp. NBC_01800]WSA73008.1 CsbD family protein [Streptomyces sp. NBC_01800]WSA81540.1 CsbD family protein [Streptomyces sp. NBC_01799]
MGIGKKTRNIGQIIEGKTKEVAGKAMGHKSMEKKGKVEKIKGKVQHAVEKGKDTFRH